MGTYSGTELPWPGGGPWRILDDCPSPKLHNTLNAARGRLNGRRDGRAKSIKTVPCICPGGAMAIKRDNAGRTVRGRIERSERNTSRVRSGLSGGNSKTNYQGQWIPDRVRMPDLSTGACAGPVGQKIMDAAIDGLGPSGNMKAKSLCGICPLRETDCLNYIRVAEEPAGSWAGVWAGFTRAERRRREHL
jgi:hypothetical protein